MGLALTIAFSHDGMVLGSTKMLLANVKGNKIRKLAIITEFGVRRINPSVVQTHDRLNEKTSSGGIPKEIEWRQQKSK